ncbi:1-acyl-sn-glycerol-3-phosphate acyltransferase [Actinomycetospora sp. OC33-EN08]|uniref:1-acyl-sn-glycerol-3-phosphate acyltransferase n=1 Tax=Actinomycetospora aurantiaca TaxID=3129233 RepID=A0ABU8MX64_9PSEU
MNPEPTPSVAGQAVALARDVAVAIGRRYHRLEVAVDAPLPAAPSLIVSNHGFGGIFDLNVLAAFAALRDAGLTGPLDILVHKIAWTLKVGPILEELGCRQASRTAATEALSAGHHLLVLPGGDLDAFKAYKDRNRIVFAGRQGFARLAIDHGVPIVPIVTAGAGESLLVLSDGQALARTLGLDRLARLKAAPISVSLPWGLNIGAVGLLPYVPLPTKLDTAVLAAIHPRPDDDPAALASRVEAAMQDRLDVFTADRTPLVG